MRDPDAPSLVAGFALIVFGTALVLDNSGAIDLTFGTLAPIACATMGATLLALGLSRRS